MKLSSRGKALCALYGALSLIALVATWSFNLQFFALPDNGGLMGFVRGGYANPAAASLTNDLLMLGAACAVFMLTEARRLKIRFVWVYVVLSFAIAISVMFPLFMVARQIRLEAR
jgi:Terpene cyclase DEP1